MNPEEQTPAQPGTAITNATAIPVGIGQISSHDGRRRPLAPMSVIPHENGDLTFIVGEQRPVTPAALAKSTYHEGLSILEAISLERRGGGQSRGI